MRVVLTKSGGRLLHGRHVVSEVRRTPGPTHSVFDVLAAAASLHEPSAIALLGFAAGGLLAPLRAIGCSAPVDAVDLSREGLPLFEACRGPWTGDVTFHEGDAAAWLRARTGRFDCIIEDLSMQIPGDVTKPPVSLEVLPALIEKRLAARGVVVVNMLPVEGMSRITLRRTLVGALPSAVTVRLDAFENEVLLASRGALDARVIGRNLRAALARTGSRLADELHVVRC